MMSYHTPVLLKESIEGLNIRPNGIYIDATYGGGGHSNEILKRLKKGKLIAFDQDADAETNIPKNKKLLFIRQNFRFLKNFLKYYKITPVDGILADLGMSSHQIDKAQRGFSFRFNGILDMRMNQDAAFSAVDMINNYTKEKLIKIFKNYGELKYPDRIANCIIQFREKEKIETVEQLVNAVSEFSSSTNKNKFYAKIFQAIRIEVNNEIDRLKELLEQSVDLIKPGGRLVMITYHSLEDRLVKNFIRKGKFEGNVEKDLYGNIKTPFKAVNKKVIIPQAKEIKTNSRARSAKLRIAERIEY